MSAWTLAEVCVIACAEAWRGDGEVLASPMGLIPTLGARVAKGTFAPDLVLTDGVATVIGNLPPVSGPPEAPLVEGWMPYRAVFDTLWNGRRHVMMGASQIDLNGNQNISCVGPWERPKVQLLGARGAPGNTICHPTSYWIPNHSPKVFVPKVDFVSGVGYDRAAALGPVASRFHEVRRVITNLAVFDFETPDHRMRLRSVHPGVSVEQVREQTGFDVVVPSAVPETRPPTDEELALIGCLDPLGSARKEVPG